MNDINQLQEEKKVLKNELEDERRKCEDMQFRLEETELMHGDSEHSKTKEDEESLNKIKDLEKKLLEEENNHKLQKDLVAGLEKRIENETIQKNQFKEQLDDVTLALESDRQKSKTENEKLQSVCNEMKADRW